MTGRITGAAMVAGVVGNPIAHSMSPVLHNGWIAAARLDAVFAPFCPPVDGFKRFVDGLRGGGVRGLNVTIPFKEQALACADSASELAKMAGAANLLLFRADGSIFADNTDGPGLIGALRAQGGFEPGDGPAVILGAGGAARGAAAALVLAGSPQVRIVNRTRARAQALADGLRERARAYDDGAAALEGAAVVINATSLGLGGGPGPDCPLERAPGAVVMDMVYKPLRTEFLRRAQAGGHRTVDGLEMLIRQAVPSFEAFFERPPPGSVDARALAIAMLEAGR